LDCDGGIGDGGIEEVPGFFVTFEAHFFGLAVGVEAEHGLGGADFYGDDVPEAEGDDVGGDEVDVTLGVGDVASAEFVGGAGFVGAGAEGVGALDLDAEEVDYGLRAIVDDEVVALGVSPGLTDGEAALAGLVEEGGFGTFSDALGVGKVEAVRVRAVVRHGDTPLGDKAWAEFEGSAGCAMRGISLSFIVTGASRGGGPGRDGGD
jgi:hypothetical protein